jgi:hypothetical protein
MRPAPRADRTVFGQFHQAASASAGYHPHKAIRGVTRRWSAGGLPPGCQRAPQFLAPLPALKACGAVMLFPTPEQQIAAGADRTKPATIRPSPKRTQNLSRRQDVKTETRDRSSPQSHCVESMDENQQPPHRQAFQRLSEANHTGKSLTAAAQRCSAACAPGVSGTSSVWHDHRTIPFPAASRSPTSRSALPAILRQSCRGG